MGAGRRSELPKDLARAPSRFQAWRGRRTGRRIPQPLWALAVRLANRHGVSHTAAVLGLDYYSLKKRVESAAREPASSSPPFVELPAPVVLGRQCQFELDNGAGATLRVDLVGYDAADVATLARTFWNAEACCRSHRRGRSYWPSSRPIPAAASTAWPSSAGNDSSTIPSSGPCSSSAIAEARR